MPFGNITIKMREALAPLLKDRVVYDLGAGDLDHARTLTQVGASLVYAIEKDPGRPSSKKRVVLITNRIDKVPIPENLDVVFLGWPVNRPIPGLMPWVDAAKMVIYLGSNVNGSACGYPGLFDRLRDRELITCIPNYRNTMIVVGAKGAERRPPTAEEAAAYSNDIVMMDYSPDEAQAS